jgi:hypothetical protein
MRLLDMMQVLGDEWEVTPSFLLTMGLREFCGADSLFLIEPSSMCCNNAEVSGTPLI